MSDMVGLLRALVKHRQLPTWAELEDAADEIKRLHAVNAQLRAALNALAKAVFTTDGPDRALKDAATLAIKALGKDDKHPRDAEP